MKTPKADRIPGSFIKEFAYGLIGPMAYILNASLDQGVIPKEWKAATVVPLPKMNPPSLAEIRPISHTSLLDKAAESFISQWTVGDLLPKSMTIDGLYKHSDKPVFICSRVTTDYSKAFDRVCHNVVIARLLEMRLQPSGEMLTSYLTGTMHLSTMVPCRTVSECHVASLRERCSDP